MRAREEIEKDATFPKPAVLQTIAEMRVETMLKLILEVVLDWRDLLLKEEK